jgi:cytochrome bd-type quinol oxidase subunit 1
MAALLGLLIQAVWDATGAYMMTPSAALPAVNEPVGWSAQAFFNPSFAPLFFHRFFGNISYTMLIAGGVFALKYMRAKVKAEKEYFNFATDFTFTLGYLAFFAMPFIGWAYARVLQGRASIAFFAIMGGHTATYFNMKMVLLVVFLVIGGAYLFFRYRHKLIFLGAVSVAIASLYILLALHPPLDWVPGGPVAWRVTYTVVLAGFLAYLWASRLWAQRGRELPVRNRVWSWLLFVAGMAAVATFFFGGNVRERSKSPYTVYLELEKPEVLRYEQDRFLLYERCVACHHASPKEFQRYEKRDWPERVAIERRRPGLDLTDEEAQRIIRSLQEQYP